MQQEQDTCRICSGPGEPDQPLFYPCKCSGTIRYIHQDCLKTWLDHSKKTTCDVCKHPYSFTKVYAPDMPDKVPVTIIIRKFAEQVISVILFVMRAVLVAFVWLTFLPYGTLLTWRLYFRFGNIIAWCISLHPIHRRGPLPEPLPPRDNVTAAVEHFREAVVKPYIRSLPADIFTGQIIASLIVLAFLAVFLLREWIQQNARPGVFDDGVPQENDAARLRIPAQAPPFQVADPIPAPPVVHHEEDLDAPDRLNEADSSNDEASPGYVPRPLPDVPTDVDTGGQSSVSSSDTESPRKLRRRTKQRKFEPGRPVVPNGVPTSVGSVEEGESNQFEDIVPRIRKEWDEGREPRIGESSSSTLSSNTQTATAAPSGVIGETSQNKGKRKAVDHAEYDRDHPPIFEPKAEATPTKVESTPIRQSLSPSPGFEFTFQAPRVRPDPVSTDISQSNSSRIFINYSTVSPHAETEESESSTLDATGPPSPALTTATSSISNAATYGSNPGVREGYPTPDTSAHSDASSDEEAAEFRRAGKLLAAYQRGAPIRLSPPPRDSSEILQPTPRSPFSEHSEDEEDDMDLDSDPLFQSRQAGPSQLPRRPPLPASFTTPTPEIISASASTSDAGTPLPSPSLATYRAPEELDEDYFRHPLHPQPDENDAEDEEEDDDEGRLTDYFVEPKGAAMRGDGPHGVAAAHDSEDEDDDEEVHGHRRREARHEEANAEPNLPEAEGEPAEQDIDDEERDQNLDEDLDGAMEAVGLRGPIFAVFQNASLMFFILTVTIGGGIWLPFTLGKTVALLTLEPRRALQILHLPIRAVRLITDPTVDAAIYSMRWLSLIILKWCLAGLDFIKQFGFFKVTHPVVENVAKNVESSNWLKSVSQYFDSARIATLFGLSQKAAPPPPVPSSVWISMSNYVASIARLSRAPPVPITRAPPPSLADHWMFAYAEDLFAAIGKQVRLHLASFLYQWKELAESDGNAARVWAVILGYSIAGFLAALYLNTFTVGNVKTAGRAVRSAIKQQMIVMKVALFIIVELVVFPFGCGIMLDYSTLRLFPEASLETRLAFFARAPVTASFYHWLIGTMFMYQFAIMLATCRELLRPGCMWFIKDPQDPTFHPIRDILDRPTFAQLRKLGLSAIMYGVVIFFGVGQVLLALATIFPYAFPLRWKMREPLSEIPIDLLFIHLILPSTLRYFRPRKPLKKLLALWWKFSARQLRLTSYMFGDRHPDEEFTPQRSWKSYLPWHKDDSPVIVPPRDGGFRRVPAGDNIAFLRDQPAMIQVDENGVPLSDRGKILKEAQDAEAIKSHRDPANDYAVVYIPPNFIRRILLFISFFWVTGSVALFSAIAVPVFAGRAVFRLFTPRELHDGYSFIIGFYLVWWSWLIGNLFIKVRIRRLRHLSGRDAVEAGLPSDTRVRASWLLFLFKRVTVYFSKILWMIFWLGFVIPTLLSMAADLYLVIPIRSLVNPGFTPTIHIFESWATGLIIAKIMMKVHRPRPGTDVTGGLAAIRRNGWRRPDPWAATKDFIIPAVSGIIGMIALPPLLVYGASKVFVFSMKLEDINRLVYPAIFVVVGTCQFALSLTGVMEKWTQSIRDKEFLVELRLRNLEPVPKDKGKGRLEEEETMDAAETSDGGLLDR
ncbi:hypothetical protein M422DRAFT_199944 [Sphaerobolus stellatus SS14]|nr:hypothetical protein M422DRAFT_199944 [Sphaerobolus stellatus SS14]